MGEILMCCENCKKYGVSCSGDDEIAMDCSEDFEPLEEGDQIMTPLTARVCSDCKTVTDNYIEIESDNTGTGNKILCANCFLKMHKQMKGIL